MVQRLACSAWIWLVFICAGFFACDTPHQPDTTRPVSANDLIQLNQRKTELEAMLIDSVAQGWPGQLRFTRNSSGIRLLRGTESSTERFITKGDTISWVGRAMLLDSTVLFDWGVDQPFSMIFEASNWPIGFHEVAAELTKTNSLMALIPSHLGWGLSGWPPLIPQDAVLWLDVDFFEWNPLVKEKQIGAHVDSWSEFLDAFESGDWPRDNGWIEYRELLPGPCIFWSDSNSKSDPGFINGEEIEITMRTFKSTIDQDSIVDFGWNKWSFQVGDDEQLLPILETMMRQYPQRKRWECHCPVDDAFGPMGVPSVGLDPDDVVGFQWEWSIVDVAHHMDTPQSIAE
jgi:hypothetical protein